MTENQTASREDAMKLLATCGMLWGGLNNIATRYRLRGEDLAVIGLTQDFLRGISTETMERAGISESDMQEYMQKIIKGGDVSNVEETIKIVPKKRDDVPSE